MKSLLDSRTAWITASAALAIMTIAYGAPLVVVVAISSFCHGSGSIPAAVMTVVGSRRMRSRVGDSPGRRFAVSLRSLRTSLSNIGVDTADFLA